MKPLYFQQDIRKIKGGIDEITNRLTAMYSVLEIVNDTLLKIIDDVHEPETQCCKPQNRSGADTPGADTPDLVVMSLVHRVSLLEKILMQRNEVAKERKDG